MQERIINAISEMSLTQMLTQLLLHPSITDTQTDEIPLIEGDPRPEQTPRARISLKYLLEGVFLETYGFFGYDLSTNTFTSSEGETVPYTWNYLPYQLVLTSLISAPIRLISRYDPKPKIIFKPILVPLYIIVFALTLLRNILKLFTEFLLTLILNSTGFGINYFVKKLSHPRQGSFLLNIMIKLSYVIAIFLLGVLHYPSRIISIVGRAMTSPLKSLKMAYAFGDALRINGWPNLTAFLRKFIGIGGALLSIALTSAISVIISSFALAILGHFFPHLLIPPGPFDGIGSFDTTGKLFLNVYEALATLFSPLVNVISSLLGTQIPSICITAGTIAGVCVTPILLAIQTLLDYFFDGRSTNRLRGEPGAPAPVRVDNAPEDVPQRMQILLITY